MNPVHLTPDQIHVIDQNMAAARTTLGESVDLFREHTARHDGDAVCAFGEVVTMARLDPQAASWLLAAAVAKLAARTATEPAL